MEREARRMTWLRAATRPHMLALYGIVLLSFFLNFYLIGQTGYGNAYYAAAIRSMTQSFHNFFYISFDPAGVVSVDKSPLGLWVQALFVLLFGYHGWAMLLPQALSGALSSLMIYVLTERYFGKPAGLIAALTFALTPAVVVASRNNTMDMQLVLVLLFAAWFLMRALETGKRRHLLLCALMLGLGFNIKMLQAYLALPAVAAAYLLFAKEPFLKRLGKSVLSLAAVLCVSFAWVAAVDITPADDRPYVGSSTNNTVMELIVGHNGLERVVGHTIGGGAGNAMGPNSFQIPAGGANGIFQGVRPYGMPMPGVVGPGGAAQRGSSSVKLLQPNGAQSSGSTNAVSGTRSFGNADGSRPAGRQPIGGTQGARPDGGGRPDGGAGANRVGGTPGNDIGTAGLFRLWSNSLYGQVGWLLIFALMGVPAVLKETALPRGSMQRAAYVFWAILFLTTAGFFSFGGFYHRYYLCMVAPALAVLTGIGFTAMLHAFLHKEDWRQWLLPAAVLLSIGIAIYRIQAYDSVKDWLIPIMLLFAALAFALLAKPAKRRTVLAAICLLIALQAGPFYWSLTATLYPPVNVTMPFAGPELYENLKTPGMTAHQEPYTGPETDLCGLEDYLVEHYREGTYLVVSQRANDVAGLIIDTGLPAVAYGGFLGWDGAISLDELKVLVDEGDVTYFLVSSSMMGRSTSALTSYVTENARLIPASEYGGQSSFGQLYLFE